MKAKLSLFLFISVLPFLMAQNSSVKPNLFIDCQMNCDFTYLKQELTFVNYMQNRQEADIYVLATRQSTGAGGREVQLAFIGENEFSGTRDTVIYFTDPNATHAIERDQFVNELKKGLLQFLVQTPMIDQISYEVAESETSDEADVINDPWNYWVFNVGGNMWTNAEASFNSIDLTGRIRMSRVTEKQKFEFYSYYNYDKSTFTLTDGEEFSSIIRRYDASAEYVFSIGPNWSLGGITRAGSSTFGNTDFSGYIKPAVEYNIFPYSEASTRRFSFQYAVGPEFYNYTDTTVYNKLAETRMRHALDIEFQQTQKWGSIEIDLGFAQYFHDLKLASVFINPNVDLVLFKGLSLDLGGYASFVSDRINIAKSDISDEDILLQIKQLDTDFTFFIYTGINYRFGSKYNNVVNQRF